MNYLKKATAIAITALSATRAFKHDSFRNIQGPLNTEQAINRVGPLSPGLKTQKTKL